MISILILIGVAIVIVAIKEMTIRKMEKRSKYLIKQETLSDKTMKKLSRNILIQLMIKSTWFHIVFFISAVIAGGVFIGGFIFPIVYVLLMIFLVVWTVIQHRKIYKTVGTLEQYLMNFDKKDLQRIVNSKEADINKKEQKFLKEYNIMEKHIGVPTTIVTIVQTVASIVMWINTF